MHGSHKLWILIAVFLVVIAFLLSMYFTATPEEMGKVIERRKSVEEKKREMKERLQQKMQQQQPKTEEYQVDVYDATAVETSENSEENKMEKYEELSETEINKNPENENAVVLDD